MVGLCFGIVGLGLWFAAQFIKDTTPLKGVQAAHGVSLVGAFDQAPGVRLVQGIGAGTHTCSVPTPCVGVMAGCTNGQASRPVSDPRHSRPHMGERNGTHATPPDMSRPQTPLVAGHSPS